MYKKQYYKLNIQKNSEIIGMHIPQISVIEGGFYHQIYELKNQKFINHSDSSEYRLPENVFLGIGKLKARTKLTSVLSDNYTLHDTGSSYLIVHESIKERLSQYNLGKHKFYDLPILHKNQIHKYFYLGINNPDINKSDRIRNVCDIYYKKEGIYQKMYFSKKIWENIFSDQNSGLVIDDS